MKKIVILGCENSHANSFLKFIAEDENYKDVEVIGVYSDEKDAMEKLAKEFNVPCMQAYDEGVGKVDGVIITARHGDNHYKYAKPYLPTGVPMFIDKPVTVGEEDAATLLADLKKYGVRVTGGSSCRYDKTVLRLKEESKNQTKGVTVGGFVRCPLNSKMGYGGFYFYSQHLVEIVSEIFGRYPKSVQVFENQEKYNVVFRYENYDVTGLYVEGSWQYYAVRSAMEGDAGGVLSIDEDCFKTEFATFYNLLCGGEQEISYEDFVAPVYVLNAIERAIKSGKEEQISYS